MIARNHATPSPFHIRNVGESPHDAQFIIDAFDSTIPHLTAAGNTGQWGTEPFSKKARFCQATRDDVLQSERFRETGQGERRRTFIAEVEERATGATGTADAAYTFDGGKLAWRMDELGKHYLAVGAVTLRDEHFAPHVLLSDDLKSHITEAKAIGNFVFLDVIVTDHRVGDRRKGAGAALIDRVKEYSIQHGKRTLWVDCWLGGTGKLAQ